MKDRSDLFTIIRGFLLISVALFVITVGLILSVETIVSNTLDNKELYVHILLGIYAVIIFLMLTVLIIYHSMPSVCKSLHRYKLKKTSINKLYVLIPDFYMLANLIFIFGFPKGGRRGLDEDVYWEDKAHIFDNNGHTVDDDDE